MLPSKASIAPRILLLFTDIRSPGFSKLFRNKSIILHNAPMFDALCALYGKLQLTIFKNSKTGVIIDEYLNRDISGIFQSSTRVSAVVFVGYDEDHEFVRNVFPNQKARNPLCEEEIEIIEGM